MSQNINLLPIDLARGKEVGKVLGVVRSAAIILGVIVAIVTLGGFGFILLARNQLSDLQQKRDELKGKVIALEASERQLVLLRDRLEKIQTIIAEDTSTPLFNAQKTILAAAPSEITLGESEINAGASTLTLATPTIDPLKTLVSNLLSSQYDRPLSISTLTLNALTGYRLVLTVN